jgi:hypothetical protein
MEAPTPWRKSSYSTSNECIEVAFATTDVAVRDSKQPTGPQLKFSPDQWLAFIARA